jgi:hypothetical protein
MAALLKFLLITILVMWLIKMIFRITAPYLLQKLMSKAQNHTGQQYAKQENKQSRPNGQINIDYIPPKDKEARAADKAGDFVDYEELK